MVSRFALLCSLLVLAQCMSALAIFEDTLPAASRIAQVKKLQAQQQHLKAAPSVQQLWPQPQVISSTGSGTVYLSPGSFEITTHSSSGVLARAISRYAGRGTVSLFFPFETVTSAPPFTLTITVSDDNDNSLQLGMDESYTLEVARPAGTASILASTVWGALRALETFSQLIEWDTSTTAYVITSTPFTITDYPRFQWRGLLLDVARHFLPLDELLTMIDAMSYNKLNTLHLHLIDDNAWPVMLEGYPALVQSAFSPQATYTSDDLATLIAYATDRGVRVVPEIDTPGHCTSVAGPYPAIMELSCGYPYFIQKGWWTFMGDVLFELSNIFNDTYFHAGGDEVDPACFTTNATIVSYFAQRNISGGNAIWSWYEQQLQSMIASYNRDMVVWEEVFNIGTALPTDDVVIHVWQKSDGTTESAVVQAGYRCLSSGAWYLDRQLPEGPAQTHYEWLDTWQDFYMFEPTGNMTVNQSLLIGGEACMWGEQVDEFSIEERVWPRASAVAERLWSAMSVTDLDNAAGRLNAFRCRMKQRGIRSSPVGVDYCPLPDAFAARQR